MRALREYARRTRDSLLLGDPSRPSRRSARSSLVGSSPSIFWTECSLARFSSSSSSNSGGCRGTRVEFAWDSRESQFKSETLESFVVDRCNNNNNDNRCAFAKRIREKLFRRGLRNFLEQARLVGPRDSREVSLPRVRHTANDPSHACLWIWVLSRDGPRSIFRERRYGENLR